MTTRLSVVPVEAAPRRERPAGAEVDKLAKDARAPLAMMLARLLTAQRLTTWVDGLANQTQAEVTFRDVRAWESGAAPVPADILAAALNLADLDPVDVFGRLDIFTWSELLLELLDGQPAYLGNETLMSELMRTGGTREQWQGMASALGKAAKVMRTAEKTIRLTLHDADRLRLLARFAEEPE